jgi:cytochrome c
VAVQEREPAGISFYDLRTNALRERIDLGAASTFDTGHTLFHMRAGAGIACASCHPEAGDDGHTWTFATIGARRTQTLRGGLLGTEPLHWNGDMKDFSTLMKEVFVGRMSGFTPSADEGDALSHFIDRQPALHAEALDKAAADRGKALFESAEVGCANCHAGSHLTNNRTENVGTGADLQVPSLKGVRFRTPLMHDGCAANLNERFTKQGCGGGDKHGKTSQLKPEQLGDLTAYLETL